jgi:hypothetical protein
MRPSTIAVLLASGLLGACAATPKGFTNPAVPGVTVVEAADAKIAGLEGRRFVVALPVELDHSTALQRFLRAARQEGAAFVSDLAVAAVEQQRDGHWLRCVTWILPVDHGQYETTTYVDSDQTVSHVEWRTVVRDETVPREECHQVSAADGATGTECHTEYVSQAVVSTEQVKVEESLPGDVREVETWVPDWKLDSAAPRCAPVEATAPQHFVFATIYAAR